MTQADLIDDGLTVDPKPSANWRWGLCWLMFASTALSYMDRQAMPLVGASIKAEFGIDNEGFGWVMSAFSLLMPCSRCRRATWPIAAMSGGSMPGRWPGGRWRRRRWRSPRPWGS